MDWIGLADFVLNQQPASLITRHPDNYSLLSQIPPAEHMPYFDPTFFHITDITNHVVYMSVFVFVHLLHDCTQR